MTSRLAIILSFVLVTLLAAGAVEFFYSAIDKAMTQDKRIAVTKAGKNAATPAVHPKTAPQPIQESLSAKKEDYTIITKRNLFGKVGETKSKKETEKKPVLTTTSLDLTLLGTIGGNANDQRAIIRDKKKNTQDIYYKGDAISQALIKEISRGKVILTVNGKDEVLLMQESKSPPGSPGSNQQMTMPDIYSTPEPPFDDDEAEFYGDEGPPDSSPPPTAPKRRMTLQPKKHTDTGN